MPILEVGCIIHVFRNDKTIIFMEKTENKNGFIRKP